MNQSGKPLTGQANLQKFDLRIVQLSSTVLTMRSGPERLRDRAVHSSEAPVEPIVDRPANIAVRTSSAAG